MRRVWLGQLAFVVALGGLSGASKSARAVDSPFEGKWKVIVLNSYFDQAGGLHVEEFDAWLLKIDKAGKTAEVVFAPADRLLKDTKPSELKADAESLRLLLKGSRSEFFINAYPRKDKAEVLQGSVRLPNFDFVPIRLEKTEAKEIEPDASKRSSEGEADLRAAMATKDLDRRLKALEAVIEKHEGKQVTVFACQALFGDLILKKAKPELFESVAEPFLKFAVRYGPEMRMQAHLTLSRIMMNYDKASEMALGHAEKSAKLLKDDENRGVKILVWIALANAQHKNGKIDGVKDTLARLTAVADDMIKRPPVKMGPLFPTRQMAALLLGSSAPLVADAGLQYARDAVKLIKEDTPLGEKLYTYRLLRSALISRGKNDETKGVAASIEQLEEQIDKEYLKTAIPFKPKKFAGRKGKSDRVVLVELFTCSQSLSCPAAQLAFDALAQTFSSGEEVALVEYHQHIPNGPDPLANPDVEWRGKLYTNDFEESPPNLFVDGKVTPQLRGGRPNSESCYDSLRKLIENALETTPEARISLKVSREGDKIDIDAKVDSLKKTGAKVKLRFLLIEETVRFQGSNRLRLHHQVVRALPGGPEGFKLEASPSSRKASVDVGDLRKKLNGYLDSVAMKARFPNFDRPLNLKNLSVVAVVQDDESKKVLQTVEVRVPPGEKETKEDKAKNQ